MFEGKNDENNHYKSEKDSLAKEKNLDLDARDTSSSDLFEETVEETVDSSEYSNNLRGWFQRFIHFVEISGTKGYSIQQLFLMNYDLRPVEAARRKWKWYHFIFFWLSESFNVNTWQIAATGVQAGLSWWVTWITVWIGYTLCALFVVASARVGNAYHISFPVSCRSSFGIWGSLWPVINRVVMACVWFGVHTSIGGNCVELMLRSIFSNDMEKRIPNHINGNITSFKLLCFFLYWFFQLPFIYFPPHKIRHLFTVKAVISPIAGITFLVWTLVKADGGGPFIRAPSTVSGSAFGWAFVNSTMNAISNFATLIVNAPDFSRFANAPDAAIYSQMISLPISFAITCLIGVLVSSAANSIYGVSYWNPLDVLSRFLDHYSRGSRGGVFLLSFSFAIAQLGTNISANSLSAGTDMTAIMPKFINIRRGGFVCAAIGFAICPWNLMTSSSMFTTYLSAYSVFLSSIAGVVFCDYYILRKGYLVLTDLYIANESSPYYYWKGFNLRAYTAYIAGVLPNIVGFVGATKTHHVPIGATYVYYFSFFAGYASAACVLIIITYIYPITGTPEARLFQCKFFEEWQDVEDFEEVYKKRIAMDSNERELFIKRLPSIDASEKA